ncbi:hypothetical protein ROZALSC1DRAFT_22407 [Rozella allomycis CSF55]|uniref:Synergin gamma C-terminal domain-containing protein n=1 Tax=Rozella allomycis (strain CSF55) TaxID=988480 RepID=A0A4P9YIW6_ROZAC|nr:hypothetical protein ROZALSC1DRAFT_22407 [Rozella allomycis CSF55]
MEDDEFGDFVSFKNEEDSFGDFQSIPLQPITVCENKFFRETSQLKESKVLSSLRFLKAIESCITEGLRYYEKGCTDTTYENSLKSLMSVYSRIKNSLATVQNDQIQDTLTTMEIIGAKLSATLQCCINAKVNTVEYETCVLCQSSLYDKNSPSSKVQWAGSTYHANCINFWLHKVEAIFPQ